MPALALFCGYELGVRRILRPVKIVFASVGSFNEVEFRQAFCPLAAVLQQIEELGTLLAFMENRKRLKHAG